MVLKIYVFSSANTLGLLTRQIAAWLSSCIVTGLKDDKFKSLSNLVNHAACWSAAPNATYSASAVEIFTHVCLDDRQDTNAFPT